MSNEPNYYGMMPAPVRYNKNLSASEKIMYAEITALSNKNGYCSATNKYFSELYGVTKQTVSGWFSSLKSEKLVRIEYDTVKKQILKRRVYPLMDKLGGYYGNYEEGIKEKDNTPIKEKPKDNSTSINNTSSNIPTVSDVRSYFSENGYSPDAGEKAYHYYNESVKGTQKQYWRDSNDKMIKNWKMKMRAVWFKPENEQNNNGVISAGEW